MSIHRNALALAALGLIGATSLALADDPRGNPGGFFMAGDINTWRSDLIAKIAKPAPANGFACPNVTRWAIGEIPPAPATYLTPHQPDVGGDYDRRPDKKLFYNVGSGARVKSAVNPATSNPIYVFCWNDKAALADPQKASTAYLIPSTSPLTVCEVANRVGGTLICR
jgi:hypothetical protein